ncbi:OmpA family protein [Pelagibius sp. Alg239-R121]|uniref:OmpA family protein n=1 Tax=Pelagibius sp. Alg239-R121 TaxID=2993448 RepID=UPI0024A68944|nr:OmpA family protein [Pelagibius sp. Alg239-R121]
MKTKSLILGTCAALLVASPVSAGPLDGIFSGWFDTDSAEDLSINGTAFGNALYQGYSDLAEERDGAFDLTDSEHFNHKARTAARRSSVQPDAVMDRDLTDAQKPMFQDALDRMRIAFERGGVTKAPQAAATAQVSYDCWIEATEANRTVRRADNPNEDSCKGEFETAMAQVEDAATHVLTQVNYTQEAAVPKPAPAPEAASFIVYFEFDSANPTPVGQDSLNGVVAAVKADERLSVRLTAHADSTGSSAYNLALSRRRLDAVTDAFIASGISLDRISEEDALGESAPLVPTGDGVREAGNRAVEISLF